MIIFVGIILLIVSFILAFRALSDLETPPEVRRLMKKKKSTLSGVIVFFKKKVVHYSSN